MRIASLIVFTAFFLACGSDTGDKVTPPEFCFHDYLAIRSPDWQCEMSLARLEGCQEIGIGYLQHTFGESDNCLAQFLADRRLTLIRIHLYNGACVDEKRCGDYELLQGVEWDNSREVQRRVIREMRSEAAFIVRHIPRTVSVFISPILEHGLTESAFGPIGAEAQKLFPLATIVDNPVHVRRSDFMLEVHATEESNQSPYGYSADGLFAGQPFFVRENLAAAYDFTWQASYNGICIGQAFTDPRERKCF